MTYQPPFTISPHIITLIAQISVAVGRLSAFGDSEKALNLRRINRVRTIRGSLAIEGNTLSEAQITAILAGKHIVAPPREIQEVRNAMAAYDGLDKWRPDVEKDLLTAHRVLMAGLIDESGAYRSGGVGVMAGAEVVHMAPPAKRVPELMRDLLRWVKNSDQHPLIVGSVFHYEFEFIHPFADGNGRMGRLWQSLILSKWNLLFADMPVESLIYAHQDEYYQALQEATEQSDSGCFITFMLTMILDAVRKTDQVDAQVSDQVEKLLAVMGDGWFSTQDMMALLGLSHKATFRKNYLRPALATGFVVMKDPDSPRSPRQKYRKVM
ncbi:MAG: Fic family protein [Mariprofundaceae bacterium]|nr:Fic family protein [Mariprofundaceae bacterium]